MSERPAPDRPAPDRPAGRRLSRGAIVALIVLSLAIPAGLLALILRNHDSSSPDPTIVAPTRARIGSVAPDFVLPDLDGKPLRLSSLRGRAVVLTFFASWCHPCEEDMPILERAQRDTGSRIAVVGVNYQDIPGDTRDFVRRLGVTFPSLIENSIDNPVATRYDVHAMPDTLFIDAAGVVRARVYGPTNTHDLEAALSDLLRPSA
ncbi:MAG: cytochrome c biosis protein CcmG, thiol:disulfide interchange protein DsbE [Actinomycetota bacterium]|nr:cytochrome c biosis protein CcmG, thiol:disulfide interchange protein DsbE [Actinomycetota bacterium]